MLTKSRILTIALSINAQEARYLRWNGRGNGWGGGRGHGHGGGGAPGGAFSRTSQMDIIHNLLDNHQDIQRTVNQTADGVETYTRSDNNPEVSSWIQQHVWQMTNLMSQGGSIRRWDPLLREISDHSEDLTAKVTNSTNGVHVLLEGSTDCSKMLAKLHADFVSGMVQDGRREMRRRHEAPEEC